MCSASPIVFPAKIFLEENLHMAFPFRTTCNRPKPWCALVFRPKIVSPQCKFSPLEVLEVCRHAWYLLFTHILFDACAQGVHTNTWPDFKPLDTWARRHPSCLLSEALLGSQGSKMAVEGGWEERRDMDSACFWPNAVYMKGLHHQAS